MSSPCPKQLRTETATDEVVSVGRRFVGEVGESRKEISELSSVVAGETSASCSLPAREQGRMRVGVLGIALSPTDNPVAEPRLQRSVRAVVTHRQASVLSETPSLSRWSGRRPIR